MKKLTALAFGIILLIGCAGEITRPPKYSDYDNDWERNNIFGKVNQVTEYKANVVDSKNEKTEDPIIVSLNQYNKFGKISKIDQYDHFGKISLTQQREYDDKNRLIKTSFEKFDSPKNLRMVTTREYDILGNPIFGKFILNDTLNSCNKIDFDSLKNPVKKLIIQKKDTSFFLVDYKYSKAGKIIWKREFGTGPQKMAEQISEFRYDRIGNLLEITNSGSTIGVLKTVHVYDNENRIIKSSQFRDEKLDRITEYDIHYNPIFIQHFSDGKLVAEMHYKYQFDKSGNWIERSVSIKEEVTTSKRSRLAYIETRKITYY